MTLALTVMLCFFCTQTYIKLTIWVFTWMFWYNFRRFAAPSKCRPHPLRAPSLRHCINYHHLLDGGCTDASDAWLTGAAVGFSAVRFIVRSTAKVWLTTDCLAAGYRTESAATEWEKHSTGSWWTAVLHLLHSAITLHHFFTVSLWAQNLHFQKILSSTLVCFCLSDWSHSSRPFTWLICSSFLCFSSIFSVLVIPKCGRLSWPALWSTFRRTIK